MKVADIRPLRRLIFGPMALLMAAGVALAFWPFYSADKALNDFCAAQATGTPANTLRQQAAAQGYTVTEPAKGTLLVDDPGGFGRRQCTLRLDAQQRIAPP